MTYKTQYESPLGELVLVSNETHLLGVWFINQVYFHTELVTKAIKAPKTPVLVDTVQWLDRYFAGQHPSPKQLTLCPAGTSFRQAVWHILCDIPYGETITYGEIAKKIAKQLGRERMSAQAIGGAVGHNPISIVIPCHRVVGADGSLTGYAGGVEKKKWLLEWEKK